MIQNTHIKGICRRIYNVQLSSSEVTASVMKEIVTNSQLLPSHRLTTRSQRDQHDLKNSASGGFLFTLSFLFRLHVVFWIRISYIDPASQKRNPPVREIINNYFYNGYEGIIKRPNIYFYNGYKGISVYGKNLTCPLDA